MSNLDFKNATLNKLITHHVGNKGREEGIALSEHTSKYNDETLDYLMMYFLNQFKPLDFYHFQGLATNEVFDAVQRIFKDKEQFIPESVKLADFLYENTTHPKIERGEFNVVLLDDILVEDEIVEAIGIFKSETTLPFIQMEQEDATYTISHDFGFDLKKIDKGCIVFNTNEENGYLVLIVDNTNPYDTIYWVEDFLNLKSTNNDYNSTKNFLDITQKFLKNEIPDNFNVSKTDQIDLLNKTVKYFKKNDAFDKTDFEENVLQEAEVINSFREYENAHKAEYNLSNNDAFKISEQALKKQEKKFKSILKLDKNFSVYIHGHKDLIEKGVDEDGRKFYKLYYIHED